MNVTVTMTWPVLSEDEDGLKLGTPVTSGPIRPIFAPGDEVFHGIVVCESRFRRRLNFGKLD